MVACLGLFCCPSLLYPFLLLDVPIFHIMDVSPPPAVYSVPLFLHHVVLGFLSFVDGKMSIRDCWICLVIMSPCVFDKYSRIFIVQ